MRAYSSAALWAAAAVAALCHDVAWAQESPAQPAAAQEEQAGANDFDDIVVTGRAGGAQITKFESSNSITTFDEDSIRQIAPASNSELFAEVPGVWAETSGGQSGNNIFVRGVPAPGQLLFSKINLDGIPLVEEFGVFAPPDGLLKFDETFERVEVVRGGASSIFASNAPAGVFNFITKKGTQDFEGVVKFEYGNFGHGRADVFFAGPIDDKTTYAVGGFYRQATGVRDAGFRGDEGGQVRLTVTRQLDKGELSLTGSFIDDRNIFYLPIPLDLDDSGNLTDFPGFDALFDTNVTNDIRIATFLQPGGQTETFDLADGIRNRAFNIGTEFVYELDNGWTLSNKNRYTDGIIDLNTNIIFDFLDGNEFLEGQLGAAQAAFGSDVSLAARFLEDGVGSTSTFAFGGGDGVFGGNAGNGFIGESGFFSFFTSFDNFFNELQLSRPIEFLKGVHNVTLGSYISIYSFAQTEQIASFVHEIAGSPRLLDIFAVDGAGDVVGAVTQNGFSQFGNSFQNYSANGSIFAFYVADEWEVTDKLRLDGGVRVELQDFDGSVEIPAVFNVSAENPFIPSEGPLAGLETLADDNVTFGTGQFIPFNTNFELFSYSFGLNYEVLPSLAFYARASDGFRTPSVDAQSIQVLSSLQSPDLSVEEVLADLPVNDIFQVEGGFKLDLPYLRAFVTGFFSDFEDQLQTDPVLDDAGNIINAQSLLSATTLGIETEVQVGPFYGFSLNGKATFQNPEIAAFSFVGTDASGLDLADTSLGDLVGNTVPRIPRRIVSIRPRYDYALFGSAGALWFDIYNVGDRFSDFANGIVLPGFTTFGAGASLDVGNFAFTVVADNLTNTIGLTEGNPRADQFAGEGAGPTVATFGRPVVGRNVRISLAYRF